MNDMSHTKPSDDLGSVTPEADCWRQHRGVQRCDMGSGSFRHIASWFLPDDPSSKDRSHMKINSRLSSRLLTELDIIG